MKPRHLFIVMLAAVAVGGVVDVAGIRAPNEFTVLGYLALYFTAAFALLAASLLGLRADQGLGKGIDISGVTVSIGSVLVTAAYFLHAYVS